MTRPARLSVALGLTLLVGAAGQGRGADRAEAEAGRILETQVRPILQAHCLACHGGEKKIKGGLRLSSRKDLLTGGDSGPAVSLEKPEDSLLLLAVNHQDRKMPPRGKLPQA